MTVKGYAVSPELFSAGYAAGRGPCTCSAVCCAGGVYADISERDRILEHAGMIRAHMDETQPQETLLWFESAESADPDFPSGRCVGTREYNGKCAFLDGKGRCSLQTAAVHAGRHKWALKPLFCILFPIEVSSGVIAFDDLLQDEETCCTVRPDFEQPLFEACREELTHLLGEDGFLELRREYDRIRKGETGA